MTSKKWAVMSLCILLALLLLAIGLTAVIDPFFHYHKPLNGLSYLLNNERYQNDGIVKHFEYDAVITGTSMTENFKTSEFDELFGVTSVKVPYSGGSFKEINDNLTRAFETEQNIRYVVRCLDLYRIAVDKDTVDYTDYPTYLYDDVLLNDVRYVLNKDVLLNSMEVIQNTLAGGSADSFDEYANWMEQYTFGKDAVLAGYERPEQVGCTAHIMEPDKELIEGNLTQNVIALAEAHPETDFYLYLPPYSVVWWDRQNRLGCLERQLEINEYAVEMLLSCGNIRLFSFEDDFELVTDLDMYKDYYHYHEDVNSAILQAMRNGEHELTRENYEEYFAAVWDFYTTYDYDSLFQ